jgi:hypothetical protein
MVKGANKGTAPPKATASDSESSTKSQRKRLRKSKKAKQATETEHEANTLPDSTTDPTAPGTGANVKDYDCLPVYKITTHTHPQWHSHQESRDWAIYHTQVDQPWTLARLQHVQTLRNNAEFPPLVYALTTFNTTLNAQEALRQTLMFSHIQGFLYHCDNAGQ